VPAKCKAGAPIVAASASGATILATTFMVATA
jgi:hypothetical protein